MSEEAAGDPVTRVEKVAAELGRATLANLEAVTDHLVAEIRAENARYLEMVPDPDDLRASCRDNLERVLQLVGHCVPGGLDPYDAARETGRRRARQRAALESVLRSFRLGGRVAWSSALAEARSRDIEQDLLLDVATWVWTVVDMVSSAVSESYRHTELDLLRADEGRRQELLTELFRGGGEDPIRAEEVLRALELPAGGAYVVVACEDRQGTAGAIRPDEALCRHGIPAVWQRQAGTLVGLAVLADHPLDEVSAALSGICGRVGISPVIGQCSHIPHARELALIALRTVPNGTAGTAVLDEHLPQALVARSPDLAERLIERTLGPVLARPGEERELLLETLDTWIRTGCSAKNTASRLYCHRNTVLNRLGRIESLLDRSIHGTEDVLWISLALHALRIRDADGSTVPGAQRTPRNGGPAI